MWETEQYTFSGETFSVERPHNILPKPYRGIHPPIWVACGNPGTFEKAGRLGIGALGFNFSPIHDYRPMIASYKKGIAECEDRGDRYIHDNLILNNAALLFGEHD